MTLFQSTLPSILIWIVASWAQMQADSPCNSDPPVNASNSPRTAIPVCNFTKNGAIIYREIAGEQLTCDVYVPEGAGPFPAIIAVHGGGWRWGSKFQLLRHAWMMAEQGYVVVTINYRLAPQHPFPAQIQDCKYAVRWMRKHAAEYKIDPGRIGGFGYSAGGHLVALMATSDNDDVFEDELPPELKPYSSQISVAVVGGAPCGFDWIENDSSTLSYWLGASRSQNPAVYRRASPTEYATPDDSPIYFFHGKYDLLVPPSSPRRLYSRLLELGIETQFVIAPYSEHALAFSRLKLTQDGLRFLDRHLKPRPIKSHQ